MKKRLGIFQMHDDDGFVDQYIFYLLDELVINVSHLIIVCNGKMREDSLRSLQRYTEDVFVRDDSGFDCSAFKEVLIRYYGWEKVYHFDELVLVNDSNFGPLFSLKNVFGEMDAREADFWAITDQQPQINGFFELNAYYYPYHLRPDFLVVREKMLKSHDFIEFWEMLGEIRSHKEAVIQYELQFTKYFMACGYKPAVYVDTSLFFSKDFNKNYTYIYENSYTLLKRGCPFIKRKVFTLPLPQRLNNSFGQDAGRTLEYIKNETKYDTNLIWNYLLRTQNVADIRNILQLNYILPAAVMNPRGLEKKSFFLNRRVAVIAHVNYTDLIEVCFQYIKNIPRGIDIFITTKGEENKEKIKACFSKLKIDSYKIVEPVDRGREISALLVACKEIFEEYDYICFTHDKKTHGNSNHPMIGSAFMEMIWENTLGSPEYIENVLTRFEEQPRLGFLSPPCPYHSRFFRTCGDLWSVEYETAKTLAENMKLKCRLSPEKPPFATGTAFWCRTAALKPLFQYGFQYDDFCPEPMPTQGTVSHAIERIFPYVAQSEGYYSGVMMSDRYASSWSVNYEYMLSNMIRHYALEDSVYRFSDIEVVKYDALCTFVSGYQKIYIYGVGEYGMRCFKALKHELKGKFAGFVVSVGHRPAKSAYTVFELPEIAAETGVGIILAMDFIYQHEVLPNLRQRGFQDFISFI